MKNLFLVNKTHNKENTAYDPMPFTVKRIPAELEKQMKVDPDDHAPTEEEIAKKKAESAGRRKLWILFALCWTVTFAYFAVFRLTGLSESAPALILLALIPIIISFVINRKLSGSMRRENLDLAGADLERAFERMHAAVADARNFLGIPADCETTVEVLPFTYKRVGNSISHAGKRNKFDNSPVVAYVSDGKLYLSDNISLLAIPIEDVIGYRTYDENFEIEMWLKDKGSEEAPYASYGLKKAGFFGRRGRTYYGVILRDASNGEEYEMLIPCYDFPVMQKLVQLKEMKQ